MLNVKKALTKILDVLSGSAATIKSGSISFPYTAEANGILTIRIGAASTNVGAYAYFSINSTVVAGWSGVANGGTNSVTFGVKKGEIVTMAGTQIASFRYRLVPVILGGVIRQLLSTLATAFFRKGVAVC